MLRRFLIHPPCRLLLLVYIIATPHTPMAVTEGLKIPNLGESSTSLFSADYEYQLGLSLIHI